MNELPEILEDGEHLTVKGLTWEFEMTDDDLNGFLLTKNEMFKQIAFRFEKDQIIAEGTAKNKSLLIGGKFAIREEPVHHIGFELVQLEYEGFALPRSTANEMEEQFNLGFYPKSIVPFVKASEVQMEDGAINIKLEIDMKSSE